MSLGMVVAALVLVALTVLTIFNVDFDPIVARDIAPAWAFGIAGLVAWRRRPRNRIGPLMVAIGIALVIAAIRILPVPVLVSMGIWMSQGPGLSGVLLGVLVLSYPTGRLVSWPDRLWIALAMGWFFGVQLALTLATPVAVSECGNCRPLFVLWYDERIRLAINNLSVLIFAGLAVLLLGLLIRRWLMASGPTRRLLAPVWLAGAMVPIVAVIAALIFGSTDDSTLMFDVPVPSLGRFLRGQVSWAVWDALPWVVAFSLLLIPLALLWGLLRAQLGQAAVTTLAIELGRPGNRASLTDSLRHSLGDRSLSLVLWSRPAGSYVTPDGLPVALPSEGGQQAVTRLEGADGPLAALLHDPVLAEQQSLVDGVAAVAQLAIENERLHAEVKAQLEEVRASRERIVRAGDEERRRVERDIHDGAQQRLVSLSLALGMAHTQAEHVSPDVAATLARAQTELGGAINELRELARGIHPAILTEAGLGAALDSLADHSPIPVEVRADLGGRLPPLVEATAYFVAAEALTNVAKHASASAVTLSAMVADGWLRLVVVDNGAGGADPARGSGLSGLLDRVAALGGRLSIENNGTSGTRLRAEIPCG